MQFDLLKNKAKNDDTLTVSQLNRSARTLLESHFGGIWVEAEVLEVTRARSGHVYFSLTDPGGKASISAVMWSSMAQRYGSKLAKGAALRCHGRVTLYEARGSFQLVVDRVEEAGAGIKALQLEALRKKLAEEGLFAEERKRVLPRFPTRVGVVTSRDGAAIQDIAKVAHRRFPVTLVLAHATVQGATAPAEICGAIETISKTDIDVLIVGRGGGSADDLDAFNDERVVRAAAKCPVPVISAVGHEIDVSLLDLVADRRAATPSEAAQMVVPDGEALEAYFEDVKTRLSKAIAERTGDERSLLSELDARVRAHDPRMKLKRGFEVLAHARSVLDAWPAAAVTGARADLATAQRPLHEWPQKALTQANTRLNAAKEALEKAPDPTILKSRERFSTLSATLNALSPLASLARGYAVVRDPKTSAIIKDADQAPPGTDLDVTLAKGHLLCEVKNSDRS